MIHLLTLLVVSVPAADKPTDATRLRGRWVVVAATFDGKKTPAEALKGREIDFGDGTFTALVGGKKKNTLTFKLDPSKKPKRIDLRREGVADPALGIYALDGGELKLCYGEPGDPRPSAFASKPGSRHFLLVLRRAKP
jgi:uncharacterized protein (TIGR03067 family)